jgi:putative ABC transport system permease protein
MIATAFRELLRNKGRAFLTMLGIIIGVASVIVMLAIGQGSKQSIQAEVSKMGSNLIIIMPGMQFRGGVQMGNDNSRRLTLEDMEAIGRSCVSVSMVSPEFRSPGQAIFSNKNAKTEIYGTNRNYLAIKKMSVGRGRLFTDQEIRRAAKVCLLGKTVVNSLFGKDINPVGCTVRFNNIPFTVIGVLEEKGQNTFGQDQDDVIVAPYTTVQKRILAIAHVQGIYASAVDEARSPSAEKEIEALLRSRHKLKTGEESDFEIRTQEELIKTFSSVGDLLTILLGAIAGISLVVGGIGIMNIMLVSVQERTKEIGLRMAIGAKRKVVMRQFLTESVLICAVGGILGIAVGIGTTQVLGYTTSWPVVVNPGPVLLSFLVCTVIGIFFGWYPARKAAHLNPIEALRYE